MTKKEVVDREEKESGRMPSVGSVFSPTKTRGGGTKSGFINNNLKSSSSEVSFLQRKATPTDLQKGKSKKEFMVCECGKPFTEHKPFNDEGKRIYICPNNISGLAPACYKRRKPKASDKEVFSFLQRKATPNDLPKKGKSKRRRSFDVDFRSGIRIVGNANDKFCIEFSPIDYLVDVDTKHGQICLTKRKIKRGKIR